MGHDRNRPDRRGRTCSGIAVRLKGSASVAKQSRNKRPGNRDRVTLRRPWRNAADWLTAGRVCRSWDREPLESALRRRGRVAARYCPQPAQKTNSPPMPRYNPATIEPSGSNTGGRTGPLPRRAAAGPKIYVLDMFPYPSGDGLHVGHPEGYTATDIVCRYQRMAGEACCTRWAGTPSACPPSSTPSAPAPRRERPRKKISPRSAASSNAGLQLRLGARS